MAEVENNMKSTPQNELDLLTWGVLGDHGIVVNHVTYEQADAFVQANVEGQKDLTVCTADAASRFRHKSDPAPTENWTEIQKGIR